MKKIITCVLFYQFLVAIDSFSPLSELTAIRQAQLKKDSKIANLFDDEDSGSGSGEKDDDKIEKAIKSVVGALRESIVPALVKATKEKEEEDEGSVKKLFGMLKDEIKRKGVEREFGKSLVESHGKCLKVIFQFFAEAKAEGLVDRLKESVEADDLDFGEIVETILKGAWKNDEGILEKIETAVEGQQKEMHPAMKAVVITKKLLLNAACGNPAEGLVKKGVGYMLSDPEKPFEVLMEKILPFLLKPRECRKGLIGKGYKTINKRVTNLLLKAPYPCRDVRTVRMNVLAALTGQAVMRNISVLHHIYEKRISATFGKVIKLMQHGFQDDAFELLGEQQFGFLREAFLIGLAINKRKPRIIQHDAPSPAKLLEYLEKESNLRRRK